MSRARSRTRRRAGTRPWIVAAALLLAASACEGVESLLEVDAPSQIPVEVLDDPVKAPLLVNGVIADFECAFGAFTVLGGILGEELVESTQTANRWPYERRNVLPSDELYSTGTCENLGVYRPLSTARWTADAVLAKLQTWTDDQMPQGVNRTQLIATTAAYAGYAYLIMGEAFCSMAFDSGPEVHSAGAFALAEERFTLAITAATTLGGTVGADLRNLALVGRARSRLNRDQYASAATDAALVTDNYVRTVNASAASVRRQNRVWGQNGPNSNATTVDPRYRGLMVQGVADTRVPVVESSPPRNAVDGARIWEQRKYATAAAPIPLASWDEAQLIRAEAAARAGNAVAAQGFINALRAKAGLPQYPGGTPDEVLAQVIRERSRELFLESHHFFDIRRFALPLTPAPGAPFSKGGTYGTTRCLPLPDVERLNNPNID